MFSNPFKKDRPEGEGQRAEDRVFAEGAGGDDDAQGSQVGSGASHDPEAFLAGDAKLRQQIAGLEEQLASMDGRFKQTLAEFANYQRRALQNEKESKLEGVRTVLTGLVPVMDNIELALSNLRSTAGASGGAGNGGSDSTQFATGVSMILEELMRVLAGHGVKKIVPDGGAAFDPMLHKAIAQVPHAEITPGHVLLCARAGYQLGERVVRPAEVVVVMVPAGGSESGSGSLNTAE
jgi:molecular chaperone GrpE